MFKYTILALLFATTPVMQPVLAQEQDGPFGLHMGTPLNELGEMTKNGRGELELSSVPKPHPFLQRYSVVATENAGLCEITGKAGPSTEVVKINREFETIKRQLISRYGKPYSAQENILLWYKLRKKKKTREMKKVKLQSIALAKVEKQGVAAVHVKFEFDNSRDCKIIEGVENPF